jgi:phage gpG-like protein
VTSEVRFVGDDAAMADLRRWADQLGPYVARDAEPFAQQVADRVGGRVPVLTGALAASVTATSDEGGVEVQMGGGLDYAAWIEFGGSHGRAHVPEGRYLYPTALEAQDEYATVASKAADESAGRFSWSTSPR